MFSFWRSNNGNKPEPKRVRSGKNKMTNSKPFIKINDTNDKLEIKNIIENKNNLPVISCIGSSRDGKSTLLNLCYYGITNETHGPFISASGDNMITSGIDYVKVEDKCILVDCQGMALTNAKYDPILNLITYLISDVIILTVRQKLDLQVLNNLLSVFTFLPNVEQTFRRNNKVKLIVRIKDYQNFGQIRKNKNYLNELIEEWLKEEGDQFDLVKQAFKNTFDVIPVATKYPTLTEDEEGNEYVNIYDDNFLETNPTFNDVLNLIQLSINELNGQNRNVIFNGNNLEQMTTNIIENERIDYRKLDLYHNICGNDLREYLIKNLHENKDNECKINFTSQMNGAYSSNYIIEKRQQLLDNLKNEIYNKVFSETARDLIDEIFGNTFNEYQKLIDEATEENAKKAEIFIGPYYQTFNNKFVGESILGSLMNGFLDVFTNRKEIFLNELNKIDTNVQKKYNEILNKEKMDLENKQKEIKRLNKEQEKKIYKIIKETNLNKCIEEEIKYYVEKINVINMQYNFDVDNYMNLLKNNIINLMNKIVQENDIVYHLSNNQNKEILQNKGFKCDFELLYQNNTKYVDKDALLSYISNRVEGKLLEIGFLRNINDNYMAKLKINVIKMTMFNTSIECVKIFYDRYISDNINKYTSAKYINITNTEHPTLNNMKHMNITINPEMIHQNIDGVKLEMIKSVIINDIYKILMNVSIKTDTQIV